MLALAEPAEARAWEAQAAQQAAAVLSPIRWVTA